MAKLPQLVSVSKIWNQAENSAFTDLIFFQGVWLCVFREGLTHVHPDEGFIRIISSVDTITWKTEALFIEAGIDLRDPKLSIAADGSLMLLVGGTQYDNERYIQRRSYTAFTKDLKRWTALEPVLAPHDWLWRVTWHEGICYGAAYRFSNPKRLLEDWTIHLYASRNGKDFEKLTDWNIPGKPNEATIRFLQDGTGVALVRRDGKDQDFNWIGTSLAPYREWKWKEANLHLGGPNFLVFPNQDMWACGRIYLSEEEETTALVRMSFQALDPILQLPSGGDCSYPGLFLHDEYLFISYYSSHEGNAAIYLAKIIFEIT